MAADRRAGRPAFGAVRGACAAQVAADAVRKAPLVPSPAGGGIGIATPRDARPPGLSDAGSRAFSVAACIGRHVALMAEPRAGHGARDG